MSAIEKLAAEFDIQVIGRIPEDKFQQLHPGNLIYKSIFELYEFDKKLNEKEVEEIEEHISTPFKYLFLANQRRWGWLESKGLQEKLAKYVLAWEQALKNSDILISFVESLFFTNISELVAEKSGIKIIKISRSEAIKNGLILWDQNYAPIFYKNTYTNENLEKIIHRTSKQGSIIHGKPQSEFLNHILPGISQIPERAAVLYKNKFTKFDPDTPKFISKYLSLISVSSRHKIYPKGHELFFDNSNDGEVFFLYPLHYEWEAQIASREPFLNQIDLARQIASILPHNTYLYVKVHPHWKNADQDLLKIYNLKKDKNIRLIKPEENTIELIKKSLGLIVINSTTGYEAIALEKPIIVIGHEAYKEIGINIKDMNELPLALMGIKNKTHKINKKTYAEFLMKYMNHVIDSSDPNVIAHEIKQLISWLSKA